MITDKSHLLVTAVDMSTSTGPGADQVLLSVFTVQPMNKCTVHGSRMGVRWVGIHIDKETSPFNFFSVTETTVLR